MGQKFKDNGRALLMGNINALATSLTVETSKADRFPVANTSDWGTPVDWFKVVLIDASGNREVVKVGTRALGSGVLGNLLRAQDGTTAQSFNAGCVVILPITAADIEAAIAGNFPSGVTVGDVITQEGVPGRVAPVGGIIMYSGTVAAIPTGWQMCDGTNGTPDLRDKFVIAARADNAGQSMTNVTAALTKSGGSKDAVLVSHDHGGSTGVASADHTHGGSTDTTADHVHSLFGGNVGRILLPGVGGGGNFGPGPASTADVSNSGAAGGHGHNFTTGGMSNTHAHVIPAQGVSGTNANLPPYYALAFIQCMA